MTGSGIDPSPGDPPDGEPPESASAAGAGPVFGPGEPPGAVPNWTPWVDGPGYAIPDGGPIATGAPPALPAPATAASNAAEAPPVLAAGVDAGRLTALEVALRRGLYRARPARTAPRRQGRPAAGGRRRVPGAADPVELRCVRVRRRRQAQTVVARALARG